MFYSWQSDLSDTRNFIKSALEDAAKAVTKASPELDVVVDEATRHLPGAPNIPLSILPKIMAVDMFVCNITTINLGAIQRQTPNSNVVFELGFAVALLGWDKVVLRFDRSIGNVPDDMPFDFDRHRPRPSKAKLHQSRPSGKSCPPC